MKRVRLRRPPTSILLLAAVVFARGAIVHGQPCPGDIDEDGSVSIEELTTVVQLASSGCPTNLALPCPADSNLDQRIAASEMVIAIHRALTSCSLGWTPGVYVPASRFAARCVVPRSGIDPLTEQPYSDTVGSVVDQNDWLRSFTYETYLWYRELPDLNPAAYDTPSYFDLLRTTATTASGAPKDRFHFSYDTEEYLRSAQSGEQVGYGAELITFPGPVFVVGYTEPGTPATHPSVNLGRGSLVLAVDGVSVMDATTQEQQSTVLRGLYPQTVGETHSITIVDATSNIPRTVHVAATVVVPTPVQNVRIVSRSNGTVGYLLFNSHTATAEAGLIQAIAQLRDAGITDLILDVRYNGGGYIAVANQLAFMIAGPGRTGRKVFERYVFNDRYMPLEVEFYQTSLGLSVLEGQALPTLSLPRVFVLTGSNTCSASESIINGLRGVDVEVIQIGWITCGKPYGFLPEDNCGTTYFTVQVQAVNAKGFGEYGDGFAPQNTGVPGDAVVPGCLVADDFTRALGDANEERLAAALSYRSTGTCPPLPRSYGGHGALDDLPESEGRLFRPPWLQNRVLSAPPLRPQP